jgi:hypothetical protein
MTFGFSESFVSELNGISLSNIYISRLKEILEATYAESTVDEKHCFFPCKFAEEQNRHVFYMPLIDYL